MPDELSKVFAALGDPLRRDMVARLTIGDATVGELAAPYEVSMPAVSKHLKVLEAAGLISRSRDAQRRPVHLEAAVLAQATEWIERYRRRRGEVAGDADDGQGRVGLDGGLGDGVHGDSSVSLISARTASRRRYRASACRR